MDLSAWDGYNGIEKIGYNRVIQPSSKKCDDEKSLPHVHIVISLLKRWLLGTIQGAWTKSYFEYYLDEFTFRFNRRNSKSRGKLFYRFLQNAVLASPVTLHDIRPKVNKF